MTETKIRDLRPFWIKYRDNIIQVSILMLMIIPLVNPLGLPIPVTAHTKGLYNIIDSLGPETKMVITMDLTIGYIGDVNPGTIAVFHHLMRKGIKMYIVGFNTDGVMLILEPYILSEAKPEDYGYVYGRDWCNLGYVPGGSVGWATFAAEIRSAVQYDKYGAPIDDIPMMQGINSLHDFDIILECGSDFPTTIVSQWQTPYQKPFITVGGAGIVQRELEPYFRSGQLMEYIAGATMGAEYEMLVGIPGKGIATIDSIALVQLEAFILVIGGNIYMLISRGGKVKK